jgi:hypothetical protein
MIMCWQQEFFLTFCFMMIIKYCSILFSWLHNYGGPKPLHYWVFEITSDTQHSKHTVVHSPGGIQPHNRSSRMPADQRLKPRGHWGRQDIVAGKVKFGKIICPSIACLKSGNKNNAKMWYTA